MVTGGNSATLTIVMRLRDEASRQMRDLGTTLERNATQFRQVGAAAGLLSGGVLAVLIAAARTADVAGDLEQSTAALRGELNEFGVTVGRAVLPIVTNTIDLVTTMLDIMNRLPSPVVQAGAAFLTFGAGIGAVAGSIALLVGTIAELIGHMRALFTSQAALRVLQLGPAGLAFIGGAIAAGAVASAAITALTSFQGGGVVQGPLGAPQLAIVHGGETVTPPGRGMGGGVTINFPAGSTVLLRDESAARALAREVKRLLDAEGR